jgi:hypothetical protein
VRAEAHESQTEKESDEMNDSKMTVDEAVAELDAITGADPEFAHHRADKILQAFTPPEILAALKRLHERADGWWYS